jgi:hypothetical protein
MKYLIAADTRPINSVPGVIQFESNAPEDDPDDPGAFSSEDLMLLPFVASARSIALRKRLDRCWLSLARGATPSIAM